MREKIEEKRKGRKNKIGEWKVVDEERKKGGRRYE